MARTSQAAPARTERRGKRDDVLDGAERAFLEHGYAGTTMDGVAAEAGVSKRTVYAHFEGKDRLFGAIVERKCSEGLWPALEAGADDVPLEDFLGGVAAQFLRLMVDDDARRLYRLVISEASRSPEIGAVMYAAGAARGIREMTRALAHRARLGEIDAPDPEYAAWIFFEAVRAPFHEKLLLDVEAPPSAAAARRAVERAVTVFLRAFSPGRPAPRSRAPRRRGAAAPR